MRVLLLTVGGSDEPIVKSIRHYQPDRVIFFCTETKGPAKGTEEMVDGEGKVCGRNRERPSIVAQTQLRESSYKVVLVEPDDPFHCYRLALEEIEALLQDDHEVIIDYTGGTKSMSVGLASAGIEYPECQLSIVSALRTDLIKVKDGMERVSKLPVNKVYIERQIGVWRSLTQSRDYEAAGEIIHKLSTYGHIEDTEEFNRMDYLTRGFAEWDRFNYKGAAKFIEVYKQLPEIGPYNTTVKQLARVIEFVEKWSPDDRQRPPGEGFLLVYDVLKNAERKADRGFYDDAVSRIYRGVEMYAQFCLMTGNPRLKSDEIDVGALPEEWQEHYEKKRNPINKKVQIGLKECYQLLKQTQHPVGEVWGQWENRVTDVLQIRNYSYLAHGLNPVTKEQYEEVNHTIWRFIDECDRKLKFKKGLKHYQQLPMKL